MSAGEVLVAGYASVVMVVTTGVDTSYVTVSALEIKLGFAAASVHLFAGTCSARESAVVSKRVGQSLALDSVTHRARVVTQRDVLASHTKLLCRFLRQLGSHTALQRHPANATV
jgi:hypothetical protein